MKNKKQWKLGICAFFVMFLLVGVMKISVLAEDAQAIDEDNISVDYIKETVTINVEEDEVIYYTDKYYPDLSKWDACEVREIDGENKAVFDISWVNEEKTVRLYLCGDVNTKVINVDLTWQEEFGVQFVGTLLAADITEVERWQDTYKKYDNFSEDTGYFIFTLEENNRDNYYFDLDTIEWRKGNDGEWRPFEELDLKEMNIRGIKLEFRIKSEKLTRASSIAKCTIAKLAQAPEITVNTDIMAIEIKNGQEFSLDKENWTLIPAYSKKQGTEDYLVDEITRENAISPIYTNQRITELLIQKVLGLTANEEMTIEKLGAGNFDFELDEEGNKIGIIVYVREAGTEKKAASLIKEVIVPFVNSTISVADEKDLEIYHGESKTGSGGIICVNVSATNEAYNGVGVKYQIAILTPEEYMAYEAEGKLQDIDVSQLKWTSIKPGRMLKLANKKVEEGSYLLYRIAGEDGSLPSTYLISEKISYDQITYVGFASASKTTVGNTLTAVISTNVKEDTTITYQWQRYKPAENEIVDAEAIPEEGWSEIEITQDEDENDATYKLTEDDAGCYIRVVVSNASSEKASEPVGPIKAGASTNE